LRFLKPVIMIKARFI
jgi:hypothetical protein